MSDNENETYQKCRGNEKPKTPPFEKNLKYKPQKKKGSGGGKRGIRKGKNKTISI